MADDPSYAIDACALIKVEDLKVEQAITDRIWAGMFRLIESHRLFTVDYVFPELARNSPACRARMDEHEKRPFMIRSTGLVSPENSGYIAQVSTNFPQMSGVGRPGNKADPWLVLLAKSRGLVMVTEEGTSTRQNIPVACQALGVDCINVLEFVLRERLA